MHWPKAGRFLNTKACVMEEICLHIKQAAFEEKDIDGIKKTFTYA